GEIATDMFVYTITDGWGETSSAQVTVTVTGTNDGPTAVADTVSIDEGTSVIIDVLNNDSDPDTNDHLTVSGFDTTGTVGTVILNTDGTFNYEPDGSFTALNEGEVLTTSFTYTIQDDDGMTSSTTVTINVSGESNEDDFVINEIGLCNVTSPVSGTNNVDFIEIRNTSDTLDRNVNQLHVELSGANITDFTFSSSSPVSIPPGGYLVMYGDGDYAVFDSAGIATGVDGNIAGLNWAFQDSNADTFIDTRDTVGVNINFGATHLDTFLANGATFSSDQWEAGPSVPTSATFLSAVLGHQQFNGAISDRQAILDALNVARPDSDGIQVSLGKSNTTFARVYLANGVIDNNDNSEWSVTNAPTAGSVNNLTSPNPLDITSGDDLNVGQNNPNVEAGQTIKVGTAGDDILSGDQGPDFLYGEVGDDILDGGTHNDLLLGGAGNDGIMGGTGGDVLIDIDGHDYIQGNGGDDIIIASADAFGETTSTTDQGDILIGDDVVEGTFPQQFNVVYAIDVSPSTAFLKMDFVGDQNFLDAYDFFQVRGFADDGAIWNLQNQQDSFSGENDWSITLTKAELLEEIYATAPFADYDNGGIPEDFEIFLRGSNQPYGPFTEMPGVAFIADGDSAPIVSTRAAYEALTDQIIDDGFNSITTIKVVSFGSSSMMQPGEFSPDDPALMNLINSLNFVGGTQFEDPLQNAVDWLSLQPTGGSNLIYFISDGMDNDGYSPSSGLISDLTNLNVDMRVFGFAINDDASNINENELNDVAQSAGDMTNEVQIVLPEGSLVDKILESTFANGDIGSDVIIGGDFNDVIFGDSLNIDFAQISADTSISETTLRSNFNDNPTAFINTFLVNNGYSSYFNVIGLKDWISGGKGDDIIFGQAGDDEIEGNEGADRIIGGRGADVIFGGEGDDTIFGSAGDDLMIGDSGNDTLIGGAGDDTLSGSLGNDILMGNSGIDIVDYRHATSAVMVDLTAGIATGEGSDVLSDIENVFGSEFADTILGNSQANTLYGFAGDDTMLGNAANDTLLGGAGDDYIEGGSGSDVLNGGDDSDTLLGNSGADLLRGGAGVDYLGGGANDDTLDGGLGDDTLVGGSGNDTLIFDSNDLSRVDGGSGHDVLLLNGSGVNVDLTALSDTIYENIERVDLTGTGPNTLTLDLADVIAMTDGNNALFIDGTSHDTVVGHGGWTSQGTTIISGTAYDEYTQGGVTLFVDADIAAQVNLI
ncbi:MAG: Ig-like domain-containing protein, partial [Gammaproteobacteria bacterium]